MPAAATIKTPMGTGGNTGTPPFTGQQVKAMSPNGPFTIQGGLPFAASGAGADHRPEAHTQQIHARDRWPPLQLQPGTCLVWSVHAHTLSAPGHSGPSTMMVNNTLMGPLPFGPYGHIPSPADGDSTTGTGFSQGHFSNGGLAGEPAAIFCHFRRAWCMRVRKDQPGLPVVMQAVPPSI